MNKGKLIGKILYKNFGSDPFENPISNTENKDTERY
jgi:hypothetical protein